MPEGNLIQSTSIPALLSLSQPSQSSLVRKSPARRRAVIEAFGPATAAVMCWRKLNAKTHTTLITLAEEKSTLDWYMDLSTEFGESVTLELTEAMHRDVNVEFHSNSVTLG